MGFGITSCLCVVGFFRGGALVVKREAAGVNCRGVLQVDSELFMCERLQQCALQGMGTRWAEECRTMPTR